MRRRSFIAAGGAFAASLTLPAQAQGAKPRVSFLSHSSPKAWGRFLQEFRSGLRALGHVEGSTLVLDLYWAENRLERIPALVEQALATKPSVIVTHGSPNVAALQKATSVVPIVFAAAGDPVAQGFVKSLRRPGGNITGIVFNTDIIAKIFELTKVVMPGTSRIAVLLNRDNPAWKLFADVLPSSAKALGLEYVMLNATTTEAIEPAFVDAVKANAQALVVAVLAPFVGVHPLLAELQLKHRLPTFHGVTGGAEAGGLAAYSFPQEENYRRAAALVDQILKGKKPAEIPVEIPTRSEITINLKTAQALGIKVPQAALLRAHKVITP
jgi:putative tryptophan/tyrosine transport system substrate-binding protein